VTVTAAVQAPPELLPLPELLPDDAPLLDPEPEPLPAPELDPLPLELPLLAPELLPLDPPLPESVPTPAPPSPALPSTSSRPVHAATSATAEATAIQRLIPWLDVMGSPYHPRVRLHSSARMSTN